MSIFQKIFGAAPAQQPQQEVTNNLQTNPQPAQTQQSSVTAPNGVVPQQSDQPEDKSPLEKFSKVWETEPTDKSKEPAPPDGLSPQKMMEAAGQVDFSQVLDREILAKVAAGGEEAVQALVDSLNKTAQSVYGRSTIVAQKLVERAVEQAKQDFASQVPGLVKRQSMREGLVTDNPAYSNPAVAPLVEAMERQMQAKYPNATATELKDLAKEYFAAAATAFNPPAKPKPDPNSKATAENWDQWIATPTGNY